MNLLQLVIKQMRQRALGTTLTLLSVTLGVALAVAILIMWRESGNLLGQKEYGFDVLISNKQAPLQATLNTIYNISRSPGNIPYSLYEKLKRDPLYRGDVRVAVPWAVGDSYKNHRIIGTTPATFGMDDEGKPLAPEKVLEYRPGQRFEIEQGAVYAADKFEAVLGSNVSAHTGLKLGDTFQATHGLPQPGEKPDIHKPQWKVVGILKPTRTSFDQVLFIPLTSFYTIAEHDVGLVAQDALREGKNPTTAIAAMKEEEKHDHDHDHEGEEEEEHYTVDENGRIHLQLPKEIWGLSAILVKARGPAMAMGLIYNINNGRDASAVNPASTMREFFDTFLNGPQLLLLIIAMLVTIVAAIGILVSIYNSVSARKKEIAILRALGATRTRILTLICVEAGLIGLVGGILGLIGGHLFGAVASGYLEKTIGEGINWIVIARAEWLYLGAVIVLAILAGLVPGLKAYSTPVATNLVSG